MNLLPSVGSVRVVAPGSASGALSRAVGGLPAILGDAPFLEEGGTFLAWTTDAELLARDLGRGFRLERATRIPGSTRKTIAVFRKERP